MMGCTTTPAAPPVDWRVAGGDPGNTRFSPLDQINTTNVPQLRVAWVYHTGDMPAHGPWGGPSEIQATPIVIGGVLYTTTPALAVVALRAVAHHGTSASYDLNKQWTKDAVVTSFHYANPHPQLFFDVTDDKGTVVHWVGELSSPSTMLAAGMSRTTLKAGDEIVIKGKSGKAENPVILIDSIVKDGKPVVGDPNVEGRFINDTR